MAALDVLAHSGDVSWPDISRSLGLARSSTSDLIGTLLDERLIRRRGSGFALGNALGELAAGFVGNRPVLELFALELGRDHPFGEHTLSVQVLFGDQTMCVDVRMGRQLLPFTPRAGSRSPVWNGERGEPILTSLDPDDVERSLDAFGAFCGVDAETAERITRWTRAHSTVHTADPGVLRASTGNDELSVALRPVADDATPAVITLQLAPGTTDDAEASALHSALRDLVERIDERQTG
ncbi:hypothetical protein GCM10027416_03470 [Okibacterium endophyticum]